MLRCLTIRIVGVVTVVEAEVVAEFVEVAVHVPDSVHVSRAVSLSVPLPCARMCVCVLFEPWVFKRVGDWGLVQHWRTDEKRDGNILQVLQAY